MKNSAFSEQKTWRNFRRTGAYDKLIRRVCCAVLILEAAVLIEQKDLADIVTVHVERDSQEWLAPSGTENEAAKNLLERIFGVRFRFEDGVIEFYRQEETVLPEGSHES